MAGNASSMGGSSRREVFMYGEFFGLQSLVAGNTSSVGGRFFADFACIGRDSALVQECS